MCILNVKLLKLCNFFARVECLKTNYCDKASCYITSVVIFNKFLTFLKRCFVGRHTAPCTYSSSPCLRIHLRQMSELYAYPTSALSSPVAVCVGKVHMLFLWSSKGKHTAPVDIFKFTNIQLMFSGRWLFNKRPFNSFIRIILIDRAYYLKKNLIGIFLVGVVFLFISFVKYI